MKFKIFTVAFAFVMVFSLVSCDKSGEEQSVNGSNSETMQSVNGSSNSEITHTAGTFDFDEAMQNFYLFDKKISLPCTVSEMGKEYTLSEHCFEVPDTTQVLYNLYYSGNEIGSVTISEEDSDDGYNSPIKSIRLSNNDEKKIDVDILGVSFQSTKTDIENIFGEPDKPSKDNMMYYTKDRNSFVNFSSWDESGEFDMLLIAISTI
jgi:hypothetical protein